MRKINWLFVVLIALNIIACGGDKSERDAPVSVDISLSADSVHVAKSRKVSIDIKFENIDLLKEMVINRRNITGVPTFFQNVPRAEINGTYRFEYDIVAGDQTEFYFEFIAYNNNGIIVGAKKLYVQTLPTIYSRNLRMISKVTGSKRSNEIRSVTCPNNTLKYDVGGTDLGIMWEMEPGKIGLWFGDTVGENWSWTDSGGPGGGNNWRSNVLAFSSDTNLEDGLTLDSWAVDKQGRACQIAYSEHNTSGSGDFTSIPTAAIRMNGVDYLHYMNVRTWESPKGWDTNWSSMYSSSDNGITWKRETTVEFGPDSHFAQVCYAENGDGYVYMIGTRSGRFDAAYLARIPENSMLDQTQYEYWNRTKGWLKNRELEATPIFEGTVGEISLMYHKKYKRWIVTYLKQDNGIVYRHTDDLTGTWSKDTNIVSGAIFPGMYCAYMHPLKMDGDRLYFLMSLWWYYNVYVMSVDLRFCE